MANTVTVTDTEVIFTVNGRRHFITAQGNGIIISRGRSTGATSIAIIDDDVVLTSGDRTAGYTALRLTPGDITIAKHDGANKIVKKLI